MIKSFTINNHGEIFGKLKINTGLLGVIENSVIERNTTHDYIYYRVNYGDTLKGIVLNYQTDKYKVEEIINLIKNNNYIDEIKENDIIKLYGVPEDKKVEYLDINNKIKEIENMYYYLDSLKEEFIYDDLYNTIMPYISEYILTGDYEIYDNVYQCIENLNKLIDRIAPLVNVQSKLR